MLATVDKAFLDHADVGRVYSDTLSSNGGGNDELSEVAFIQESDVSECETNLVEVVAIAVDEDNKEVDKFLGQRGFHVEVFGFDEVVLEKLIDQSIDEIDDSLNTSDNFEKLKLVSVELVGLDSSIGIVILDIVLLVEKVQEGSIAD